MANSLPQPEELSREQREIQFGKSVGSETLEGNQREGNEKLVGKNEEEDC